MQRMVVLASLSLLLGLATTIGVAWWLAARTSLGRSTEWYAEDGTYRSGIWSLRRWEPGILSGCIPAPGRAPVVRLVLSWRRGNDFSRPDHVAFDALSREGRAWVLALQRDAESALTAAVSDSTARAASPTIRMWDARGWPLPALSCQWRWEDSQIPAKDPPTLISGGIPISPDSTGLAAYDARALPFCPLWRGFLVDAALFTAAWSLILVAPAALRYGLRQRRLACGCCTACGYAVAGLPAGTPCPECGTPT